MNRLRRWQIALRIMLASSLMGTMFQAGCLGKVANNVNPCGTILDCDPLEWDLMFNDYPDWNLDPTCTIPGLCGGQWPPPGVDGGEAVAETTATTQQPSTGTGFGTGGFGSGGFGSGGFGSGGFGSGGFGSGGFGGGSFGGGFGT